MRLGRRWRRPRGAWRWRRPCPSGGRCGWRRGCRCCRGDRGHSAAAGGGGRADCGWGAGGGGGAASAGWVGGAAAGGPVRPGCARRGDRAGQRAGGGAGEGQGAARGGPGRAARAGGGRDPALGPWAAGRRAWAGQAAGGDPRRPAGGRWGRGGSSLPIVLTSPSELRPSGVVPLAVREIVLDEGVIELRAGGAELAEALMAPAGRPTSPTPGRPGCGPPRPGTCRGRTA